MTTIRQIARVTMRQLLLPLVFLAIASSAHAHERVRLYGRVVDEATTAPIAGARVTLLRESAGPVAVRITDEAGEFEFIVRRDGGYSLNVTRLGYRDSTTPRLLLGEHSLVRIEVRLDVDAVLLAPLEIVARSPSVGSPMLSNFRARLQSGMGSFITRDQIIAQMPSRLTDMIALVPGVRLESSGGAGHQRVVHVARASLGCPAQVFIDGFLVNRPGASLAIDDLVNPASVEGVEVYRGMASVPAEFLNSESARCGVVAIWTRRGVD